MKENNKKTKKLPSRLLESIKLFLESELLKLKRTQKSLKNADPFSDDFRVNENSLEEDLDEQISHFESEVKVKFLTKRIIQLRKALTRMKFGKYGICEVCGKLIDTERLSIHPEATTCVKCEKEKEA